MQPSAMRLTLRPELPRRVYSIVVSSSRVRSAELADSLRVLLVGDVLAPDGARLGACRVGTDGEVRHELVRYGGVPVALPRRRPRGDAGAQRDQVSRPPERLG